MALLDPTAVLWPHLDLTNVRVLRWPGVEQLVSVDSARPPLAVRIARHVVKRADGCWVWTGPVDDGGYGRIKVHQKDVRLPRLVWQIEHGKALPPTEVVRHTCDNPPCIRPAHLLRGSVAQNNQDRNDRGRTSKGAQHYAAKLSEASVREIRRRSAAGEQRISLAREFGVSGQLVSRVVLRQIWTDLEDA